RVIRSAREMGIECVAVHSAADSGALHMRMAHIAVALAGEKPSDGYLDGEQILAAALSSGSEAVHPGYGFLSENADFARAVTAAGLTWIGPPPEAIEVMGDKLSSRRAMVAADVLAVPGGIDAVADVEAALEEAERVGYPIALKAAAGGGGKGMRLVERPEDFKDSLASARREAKSAFGNDSVLVEKFITSPRHIEIQVFGDSKGGAVHLFERDCSVQRRHQKIIEEAPAPGMSEAMRAKMGAAAVTAVRAINYEGAGTIEFIVDSSKGLEDAEFYFMEMNTRLQVEHPVTEMITGLDLVEWQIRVAAGQPLPLAQDEITLTGHAIEVRLYAEDAAKDFLPAIGVLHAFRPPAAADHLRVETGVSEGDAVSIHYDPMIAKIVTWGASRDAALARMETALAGTAIAGLTTNLEFLAAVLKNDAFRKGGVDTGFIARHMGTLISPPTSPTTEELALAAAILILGRKAHPAWSNDHGSPWHATSGWRMNIEGWEPLSFMLQGTRHDMVIAVESGGVRVRLATNDQEEILTVLGGMGPNNEFLGIIDGREFAVASAEWDHGGDHGRGHTISLMRGGSTLDFRLIEDIGDDEESAEGPGAVIAPMPGKIIDVLHENGAAVEAGAALIIMEAMKMEYTLTAPRGGTVDGLQVKAGDQVSDGQLLLTVSEAE
ncbi:MAG: ATP-grasp domain-containing protein, partial [Proteobacteria bacterium]|nr:ATP-grasp domain-containing protein [Pseudomonadota bacterium]